MLRCCIVLSLIFHTDHRSSLFRGNRGVTYSVHLLAVTPSMKRDSLAINWKKPCFWVGRWIAPQTGKAGMCDSGKTTRSAEFLAACLMREMHFWVIFWADSMIGET